MLRQLPTWLVENLASNRVHVSDWLDSVYDRDWIWLSARQSGQETRIFLLASSLPLSTWSLREVIEASGGKVSKDDLEKVDPGQK
ncbi:MAG: hypothetical protein DWQ37_14885 [Planctomycetota bacterium]|nr:MAG: hypothetical protein DWQ37_14885 [Planctomycetota bacterium]